MRRIRSVCHSAPKRKKQIDLRVLNIMKFACNVQKKKQKIYMYTKTRKRPVVVVVIVAAHLNVEIVFVVVVRG